MSVEMIEARNHLIEHFNEMIKDVDYLFEVNLDKAKLWDIYLDNFPEGTNEIYRERRYYDCVSCRSFVKHIGHVVVIKDNKMITIWDVKTNSTFQPSFDAMDKYVKSQIISDVFLAEHGRKRIGVKENYEMIDDAPIRHDHFYLDLPERFLINRGLSKGTVLGQYRDKRNVFKRALEELTEESLNIVLELIDSNTLYKGAEYRFAVVEFLKYKKEYELLPDEEKDLYTWAISVKLTETVAKIKNTSIGTLLTDISEGEDLDTAVSKYEKIVAPENYKRSKPIFTEKMKEDAKKTIAELGYTESLGRRYATLDDISVNDILFSNKDAGKRIAGSALDDIFGKLENNSAIDPKKFSRVEEITIDKFISDVLPTASEIELLLEPKHTANMVSLIAPENKDAKSMLKWDNNFGWAYTGNITDSSMKERVKAAGGKVDGVLRYSIQWNDTEEYSPNDVDAHCIEPNGNRIYYANDYSHTTKGNLDVDIRHPRKGVPAVENITWPSLKDMKPGVYKFMVHMYDHRGGRDGVRAEIEFYGNVYSFDYSNDIRQGQVIVIAEVTLDENGNFSIKELIPSVSHSSKEVWGVHTNQFVPVSVVCFSPNYWNRQEGNGHKHVFFMLKDCKNPEEPNGFYNEFLKDELYRNHRKVFEALGSAMKVNYVEDQLSGVGFSTTKRNEVTVKVKGNTERVLKIKF